MIQWLGVLQMKVRCSDCHSGQSEVLMTRVEVLRMADEKSRRPQHATAISANTSKVVEISQHALFVASKHGFQHRRCDAQSRFSSGI